MVATANGAKVDTNTFVQRVLVYRLGSLGDTVVALPALHLIARAFPRAERRLLTNFPIQNKAAAAQTVLDGSGLIHGYFSYAVGMRQLSKLIELRRQIRSWRPDVLVYLMGPRGISVARRDALFFRLCGIRRQIGVPLTLEMQTHLELETAGLAEAEASRLARCVAELGDAHLNDPSSWNLKITEAEQAAAATALKPFGKKPILAFSVGTKMQPNDWGTENWRELLARLAQLYPAYALVIVGAASEYERSSMIAAAWQSVSGIDSVLNLCGQMQPRESAAIIASAKLFLGHDSGPMHLAAAVRTPVVAVFSARNKAGVWYPHGDNNAIVRHEVECSGCDLETCIAQQKKCILSITVEEVLERVKEILPPRLVIVS